MRVSRAARTGKLYAFQDIIGDSPPMQRCIQQAMDISSSKSSVVIHGESGTGKEMFAQAIHVNSRFDQGPFVAINCGAIPKDLVESELFGYEDGAFTGARRGGMPGKFEMANHGTIFLDEIGEMPLSAQVSLLRVIQERNVVRIGGHKPIHIKLRIISATNKDLAREVQKGNFREELYYRLNVIKIHIPPLRERNEDVLLLANHYLKEYSEDLDFRMSQLDSHAAKALRQYRWPGNVRELANAMESAINLAKGQNITLDCLPESLSVPYSHYPAAPSGHSTELQIRSIPYNGSDLKKQEAATISKTLESVDWNITKGAEALGIARNTLYRKLRKYGIERSTMEHCSIMEQ